MKSKTKKDVTVKPTVKAKKFDALVKELQENQISGCCSDKNVCDIRCSPLYGGCGDGEGDCC